MLSHFVLFHVDDYQLILLKHCLFFHLLISQHLADDYRLFCGDLGNEVNDDVLSKAFARFPSFNMARVRSSQTY